MTFQNTYRAPGVAPSSSPELTRKESQRVEKALGHKSLIPVCEFEFTNSGSGLTVRDTALILKDARLKAKLFGL